MCVLYNARKLLNQNRTAKNIGLYVVEIHTLWEMTYLYICTYA